VSLCDHAFFIPLPSPGHFFTFPQCRINEPKNAQIQVSELKTLNCVYRTTFVFVCPLADGQLMLTHPINNIHQAMRGVLEALNLPATDDCTIPIGGYGTAAELSKQPPVETSEDATLARLGGPFRRVLQ
jgi:hypothetical protein